MKKIVPSKGFTLIETVIAIFILVTGIIGVYAVFSNLSNQTGGYSQKLIASYLAQEGIEIIRNMRDNNWVQNPSENWLSGIDTGNCSSGCDFEADYRTGIGIELSPFVNDGRFLNIDSNNVYSYNGADNYLETIFKRKITITNITDPIQGSGDNFIGGSNDYFDSGSIVKVSSLVMWQYKGKDFSFKIDQFLYNWY